jgi:hypothetical protein
VVRRELAFWGDAVLLVGNVNRLFAVGAGIVIIALFAGYPSVNAYHHGAAGLLVSVVFLATIFWVSTAKRIHVLAALLVLAFIEPGTRITNSLDFNVVSNGLVIGAGVSWILGTRAIPRSAMPILGVVGGMGFMTLVFPMIVGELKWIHVHDTMMFAKLGIIVLLAFSCTERNFRSIVAPLAISSLGVAALAIVQAFHIPWLNHWIFETYFASSAISADTVLHLIENYFRSFGTDGPVGTASLLVMSLGAWFILIIRSQTTTRSVWASLGLSVVLVGMLLTGSRLGVLIALPVLSFGFIWWTVDGRTKTQGRILVASVAFSVLLVVVASATNQSFGRTVDTVSSRFVSTIPRLLNGMPDESFRDRLAEYSDVELGYFEVNPGQSTELTSEYLVLLERYGLAGLLLTWQLWIMILTRSMRSANNGRTMNDRYLGMTAMVVATSLMIGGVGIGAILDPTRMTILLIVFGLTPAMSPFYKHSGVPVSISSNTDNARLRLSP